MCGIIGYTGTEQAVPIVMNGLATLESRGYDSAGIASIHKEDGMIIARKKVGKTENLVEWVRHAPLGETTIAIGHNRWATHGKVTETNCHPHVVGKIAVVHNGIIENHLTLREDLQKNRGCTFKSETDTEVVPQLINLYLNDGLSILEAVQKTVNQLTGSFALGIMYAHEPNTLYAVRSHQPLVIGFGPSGSFMASSVLAIASVVNHVIYLENGEIAVLSQTGASLYDFYGKKIKRDARPISVKQISASKEPYRHYLLKEIHEQPTAVGDTIRSLSDSQTHHIVLPHIPFDFKTIDRLSIVACGTASHAGLIAQYWFEELAGLAVDWSIASEFCYRPSIFSAHQAGIVLSQSGETKDTMTALEHMRSAGCQVLAIVNVPESSLARAADGVIYTEAYPETSVASTKAFTTQLCVLLCLALEAGVARGKLTKGSGKYTEITQALDQLPTLMHTVLALEKELSVIAAEIAGAHDVFYVGRGTNYPLALEGALKLKEISYIHAEGYPAGELKHGPLALIDKSVPTIAIVPNDRHFEKTASNLQEISAREGKVIAFSNQEGSEKLSSHIYQTVILPTVDPFVAPILYVIPLQLLAYFTAVRKGTDVDNPRNLAKSVTTE